MKKKDTKPKKTEKKDTLLKKVQKNEDFEMLSNGKIHCKITGHDLKASLEDFKSYLNSRSYKIAKDKNVDLSKYLPHLVEYKKDNKFLFCKLTKKKLIKRASVLEKHVNGKKFKKFAEAYEEKQRENGEQNDYNEENIEEEAEEIEIDDS